MNTGPMNPNQQARFQERTEKAYWFNWRTRACERCHKGKSRGQFDGESKVCKGCA